MNEGGQRVGRLAVEQNVELDKFGRLVAGHVVVKGSVTLGDGLELVVEVKDYL